MYCKEIEWKKKCKQLLQDTRLVSATAYLVVIYVLSDSMGPMYGCSDEHVVHVNAGTFKHKSSRSKKATYKPEVFLAFHRRIFGPSKTSTASRNSWSVELSLV